MTEMGGRGGEEVLAHSSKGDPQSRVGWKTLNAKRQNKKMCEYKEEKLIIL